jgi:glycosyltransferase involved in cell wall biosynthesis
MPTHSLRWRITEAIRRELLSTSENHPVRRAYAFVRQIPGVRQIWRLVDTGPIPPPAAFRIYVKRRGVFGDSTTHDPDSLPPIVSFDDEAFFPNLIKRIEACEPKTPPADSVVLINNGLSAGGAERQIVNTLFGLKKRGVPAIFIGEYLTAAPGHDFHLPSLTAAGVDARGLERVVKPGSRMLEGISRPVAEQLMRISPHMLLEILDMARMLRAIRPRTVHLWQDETSIKHAISALIAGTPTIILSGRNVSPTNFAYHQTFMRPGYRALLCNSKVVFSNNSFAGGRSYAEWLEVNTDRIRVVHNGLDFSTWPAFDRAIRETVRGKLGLSPGALLVIGVFRLAEEKRPLLWVDVAAETLKRLPNVRFAIAGEGPMRRQVETHIGKLGLTERIQLIGQTREVSGLFMAADAFLLTSAHEGVPNVLLEAQWYGRPVLVTPAGGAPEAMLDGVTGRIASSETAAAIAVELVAMLTDNAVKQSALANGQAFVSRAFGLERMLDETLHLYER